MRMVVRERVLESLLLFLGKSLVIHFYCFITALRAAGRPRIMQILRLSSCSFYCDLLLVSKRVLKQSLKLSVIIEFDINLIQVSI